MKNAIIFFAVLILNATLLVLHSSAQAPQAIPYQGEARDNNDNLLVNQSIALRLSIVDVSASGTVLYSERQTATTSSLGLFSINIGQGTLPTGTFASINWGTNNKYLKVEMDPAGGTSYVTMGTSQLLSVPYALYSNQSASVAGANHYIGESYGGGIVFYVYDNGQHGLIAATADQSTGIQWWNGTTYIYCNKIRNDGISIGRINTDSIIGSQGLNNYAARICAQYLGGGFGDWYLPTKYELNLLYLQQTVVGGFASNYYWSSTEYGITLAWYQNMGSGTSSATGKQNTYYVRAIRSF